MKRGKLIVIEGPDGAGKSTLAASLAAGIEKDGHPVRLVREPGGTALSEEIRKILKGEGRSLQISPRAETLLFCAARAELVSEVISPLLEDGVSVVLDRFEGSTAVYQGMIRGLGQKEVLEVSGFATGGLRPDLVLVLHLSREEALRRMKLRDGASPDRMERETRRNLEQILEGYLQMSGILPEAELVPSDGSPEDVLALAQAKLERLF